MQGMAPFLTPSPSPALGRGGAGIVKAGKFEAAFYDRRP
jgi:hypothetical protein